MISAYPRNTYGLGPVTSARGESVSSPARRFEITGNGTCGAGITCQGSNWGRCCSEHGYCGNSEAYCGRGCNPDFGVCGNDIEVSLPANACPSPVDAVKSTNIVTWTDYVSITTTITELQVMTTAKIVPMTSTVVVSKILKTETTIRTATITTTTTSTLYRHATKMPTTTVFIYRQPGATETATTPMAPSMTPSASEKPEPTLPGTTKNCEKYTLRILPLLKKILLS
jgi:hypothetical protein